MLKRNRLMCLTLLPMFMTPSIVTPFQNKAGQLIENKVDNKEVVFQTNKLGMIKTDFEVQIEKDKFEKQKMEERLRKEKELEKQKKNEPEWKEYILTFYSNLDMENYQGCGGKTSTGSRLFDGVVASNYYKINTKIKLEGWGEVIVLDRGSHNFDSDNRLDVYIPRLSNESDYQYHSRVEKMGIQKVKGFVIK